MTVLVIFSGLPGTGKSRLANRLARELQWPLLRIDDVVLDVPQNAEVAFWDSQITILLGLAEAQLELGLNVIVDSVFMNTDRHHAQRIARKYASRFRPIYTFLPDDKVWEDRLMARYNELNSPDVATWEQVKHQRTHFRAWEPGTALFVDALKPPEENFAKVLQFVASEEVNLKSFEEIPLMQGKYH